MRQMMAIGTAKLAAAASRYLRLGGGTAVPGIVAERIDPSLVRALASQLGAGVLITGTNGKTTTARLLASAAGASGLKPVANRSGSNLMRGIGAALVQTANLSGRVQDGESRLGLFEVDEATLPAAVANLRPDAILFTNLFRDQLDRYGEVSRLAEIWRTLVSRLDERTAVLLNADDPSVAGLADSARGSVVFFGLASSKVGSVQSLEHAADARWCPSCRAELCYGSVSYGHLGEWRCSACKRERPNPQVEATRIEDVQGGMRISVSLPEGKFELELPLRGLYNAYNALAAVALSRELRLGTPSVQGGFATFTAAFGRQERLVFDGREVQVVLAKNPVGFNEVLRTITESQQELDIAFFLNDRIADGRDVSWIWDVDFEMLVGRVRSLVVSGTRGEEMALRLKYADVAWDPPVVGNTEDALRRAIRATPIGRCLYVVPTYTAMLEVRRALARWTGQRGFWED